MGLMALLTLRWSWDEIAAIDDGHSITPREYALARIGRKRRRFLREEIKRLAAGGRHDPVVYFARAGRHVKIGTTTSLQRRMTDLYLGLEDIYAIVPGDRHLEAEYHERFAHCRVKDDGRAELFYLTWNLRVFLSRRRLDFWDVMNSYGFATVVLCGFVWVGVRALILSLLTFVGGLGFQYMRPGWNHHYLPSAWEVAKDAFGELTGRPVQRENRP